MNVRVVHEGSWAYPGGAERTAREMAHALDASVTVGHSSRPEFWTGTDVEFPFQTTFHEGASGRFYLSRWGRSLAEFRLARLWREREFDEDVVVTSGTTAKWWVPRHDQHHVHYCHVPPPRFFARQARGGVDWGVKTGAGMLDRYFADFCTTIVSNSEFTRSRVRKHYGRADSPVINPPVETDAFYNDEPASDPYFVMVGRLTEMKRAATVARAFADLDAKLVLVGDGPLAAECRAVPGVTVYPDLTDAALRLTVSRATGGIAFAREEHCGITPKEFQAAGKPVVVPDEPNLANHVRDGTDGVVVEPTVAGVVEGVRAVTESDWDPETIHGTAERWSTDRFHAEVRDLIADIEADEP